MGWPLFNKRKKLMIPPHATFRISQAGEEEMEKFLGDDQHAILVALKTNGTSTIDDLAARSGLDRGTVEKEIPPMVNKQYIQLISGGSAGNLPDEG